MKLFRLLTVVILLIATNAANAQCISPTLDGYTYDVVQIGDQCWFAENLRTTILQDGTPIPEASDFEGTDFSSVGAWSQALEGDIMRFSLPDTLEGLSEYNSHVYYNGVVPISTEHGLASPCPVGWRVASEPDWVNLINYVATSSINNNIVYNLYSEGPANSWGSNASDEFGVGPDATSSGDGAWIGAGNSNILGFNIKPTGYELGNINIEIAGTSESPDYRIDWFKTVRNTAANFSTDPVYLNPAPRHLSGNLLKARYWMGPIYDSLDPPPGAYSAYINFDYFNFDGSLSFGTLPWRAGACIRCILSNPELIIPGCTDITACNYDPSANSDDGSCEYPQFGYDCACNQLCYGDFNNDGIVTTSDLLLLLGIFGTACP